MRKKTNWLKKIGGVSKKFGKEITHSRLAKAGRSPVKLNKRWY